MQPPANLLPPRCGSPGRSASTRGGQSASGVVTRRAVANATRNGVPDRVHCAILDAEAVRASAFPLVIANLLAQAHLRLAARYRAMVAPHGALILGGILEGEASELVGALEASGFRERERRVLDGWASLLLRRV